MAGVVHFKVPGRWHRTQLHCNLSLRTVQYVELRKDFVDVVLRNLSKLHQHLRQKLSSVNLPAKCSDSVRHLSSEVRCLSID